MNLKRIVLFFLPRPVKKILKKLLFKNSLSSLISPYLSNVISIDVGASYFPHTKFSLFINSPKTHWIAVEPNKKNLTYVDNWEYESKIETVTTGLSRDGGLQTLYVTNIDSGSSLYPPVIEASMKHRVGESEMNYFFPLKEVKIETKTLVNVAQQGPTNTPIIVKLDTQGTELSILQGAKELFDKNRIVGIEMESTLLAQPIMQGSGKFWQACQYLEEKGFELLDIDVIRAGDHGDKGLKYKSYLNECDAVFSLRRDVVAKLYVDHRVCLFGFYVSYKLYREALGLLEDDNAVQKHLSSQGANVQKILEKIKILAV